MKKQLLFFFLFSTLFSLAQNRTEWKKNALVFTPEILGGITAEANEGFPQRKLQKQGIFAIGRSQKNNSQEWAQRLKGPKTGLSFGYTNFGNLDSLGAAFTLMPFIEFRAFNSNRFKLLTGMGASYFTKKFDAESNPKNEAVTTNITWAFRMYLYYHFLSTKNLDWRFGLGYSHHSNGHTRLLNQGYNSFLLSLSTDINNPLNRGRVIENQKLPTYKNTICTYYDIPVSLGENVFALAFNDLKPIYTVGAEYGHIYNNTFKVGVGFYYRFYQHYYDYIKGNESLVQAGREFDYFKGNPLYYASNLGVTFQGEVLLNHIGIDLQIGFNLFKPAYKLDYRINEGWDNTPREIPHSWVLGELGSSYKKKFRISARSGLKYYLVGMEKAPKNNLYLAAHINTNFGQADFTELGLGYLHRFNFREKH